MSAGIRAMVASDDSRHRYYLGRSYELRHFRFRKPRLTPVEIASIEKHGQWFMALERGYIRPQTEAQRHFVNVCKGVAQAETEHEKIWEEYNRAVREDKAAVALYEQDHGIGPDTDPPQRSCPECRGSGVELSVHGASTGLPCSYCDGEGFLGREPESFDEEDDVP